MTGVLVTVRKYDGGPHWSIPAVRLGEDAHGVWLGQPEGTVYSKATGPVYATTAPQVLLCPRDSWWTANFYGGSTDLDLYCDVAAPVEWTAPDAVTIVDLDLDVCRVRADGRVFVDDEDEFADHQVRYGYPPEVVAAASASAAWLVEAVTARSGPFGGGHLDWLARIG
ncbi:DUF402 domain-containing protein [Longispora sp. NPDC051575]|uniref:DUF402 domain-containing protein n=1 Tax=Longispora sp. NPDC051575 TaxID=3154943 RepID=UPI003437A123